MYTHDFEAPAHMSKEDKIIFLNGQIDHIEMAIQGSAEGLMERAENGTYFASEILNRMRSFIDVQGHAKDAIEALKCLEYVQYQLAELRGEQ